MSAVWTVMVRALRDQRRAPLVWGGSLGVMSALMVARNPTLEDDQQVFPPGNVTFVASKETADAAGPDLKETVEKVQQGLTERVMQELNARVDIDREEPRTVARAYLRESGFIE